MVPTDNLTRSFPFTFEPKRPLYCPVSTFHFDEMRIYVTDSLGRPVNFNGIDWFMTLILHSMLIGEPTVPPITPSLNKNIAGGLRGCNPLICITIKIK